MSEPGKITSNAQLLVLRRLKDLGGSGAQATQLVVWLEMSINHVTSALHALHQRGCVSRTKENHDGVGRAVYRYHWVSDTPTVSKKKVKRKESSTPAGVLLELTVGRVTSKVTLEEAKALHRQLDILFGARP